MNQKEGNRDMTEEELYTQYEADFRGLKNHPGVILELKAIEAWCLASQIQLATRHPDNLGESRRLAEAIARQILTGLATTLALKIVAERGWNPDFDEPREPGQIPSSPKGRGEGGEGQ